MISETLKNLSREKLEELCQLALNREHIATRRVNELEDRMNKAIDLIEEHDDGFNEEKILDEISIKELSKILKGEE